MTALERLLNDAMSKGSAYAKAYNEGGKKKSELSALKKAAMSAMDTYNSVLAKETYKRWNAEGDPVKTAIRSWIIPNSKKFQFKTDDDNYMTVVVKDAECRVNLPMMQVVLGKQIFAKPDWFNKAEKLACIISARLNEHVNNSANWVYDMADEASKEFSFPDHINPLTDDGVVYAMQEVFDSILWIDNPDNPGTNLIHATLRQDSDGNYYAREWTVIRERMTKDGGKNTISVCNTGRFTDLIVEAMNGILTNGDFGIIADAAERIVAEKEQ